MEELLVKCVKDIDFDKISEEEREIIFSQELQLTGEQGRVLGKKLQQFIDSEKAQKERFGEEVWSMIKH
jgi:hypothetical protein